MPSTRLSSSGAPRFWAGMTSSAVVQYAEGRVQAGNLELRYVQAGEGEPLVWLHGGAGLHQSAGTDLLTRTFRVIAVEQPGFGPSGELATARTFDELSEQVAAGIDALGLSEYLLHGTSFGAATALHLALNHPDRVTGLILESPAAFRPPGWTPPDLDTVRRGLFRHPERARRVEIDPQVAMRDRAFVNRMSLTVDREALAGRLRGLTVPTLVMFGESDTLTPPDLASMYCDNAPDCSVVLVRGAAHVISSDQPDVYATTVRDFATTVRPSD
jgi:pimeloyl-ACP methyl ester carboxylesterase